MVLVYCEIEDGDSDLLGNEPVFGASGELMGIGGSGAYSHAVGKGLGFIFVTPEYEAPGSTFEIQMLGVRRRATVLAEPAYDPTNEAIRMTGTGRSALSMLRKRSFSSAASMF